MEHSDYDILRYKKPLSVFLVVTILLCVGLLIIVCCSFHNTSEPQDLIQISCSFDTYEIKRHTRSTSYDLLLISDAYGIPFEMGFFDGYKDTLRPEDFCAGNTYSLLVLPLKSSYVIYSCFDASGNCIMTKREAYVNSQQMAHILLVIMLHLGVGFPGIILFAMHCPELFSDRIKGFFFFSKRKTL